MKFLNGKYRALSRDRILRPSAYLVKAGKEFPGIWNAINQCKAQFHDLPSWCFIPENVDIYEGTCQFNDLSPRQYCIPALASWRTTQGIFTFDKDVMDALWDTSIQGDIPSGILDYLPHHCVYVDSGERQTKSGVLHGFFAMKALCIENNGEYSEWIRIVLDMNSPESGDYLCPLFFKKPHSSTIEEVIDGYFGRTVVAGLAPPDTIRAAFTSALSEVLPGVLSLLISLCAENGACKNMNGSAEPPANAVPKKTKTGLGYFPPDHPTVWEGAWRIGAAIRAARAAANSCNTTHTGVMKPAHIRRAHWHAYWTGPHNGERKVVVKWMPPLAINVKSARDLIPAVIGVEVDTD